MMMKDGEYTSLHLLLLLMFIVWLMGMGTNSSEFAAKTDSVILFTKTSIPVVRITQRDEQWKVL